MMSGDSAQFDERYVEYVELFNKRMYYDCHEVLEDLWLDEEHAENRLYYKALIQYAAALLLMFRRNYPGATARFRSAHLYFEEFPAEHLGMNLGEIRSNINYWLNKLSHNDGGDVYRDAMVPRLKLTSPRRLLG